MDELKFGDYVQICQKRYGIKNVLFEYKVVGTLQSNTWVDVPVQTPDTEVIHGHYSDVARCICCGICETDVRKYRIEDIKVMKK